MPKVYGVKEKDQVVAHVVNLILTGKLRTGDRIDRNEIAGDLGLSRVPVQEAVVQMEHDGILTTRYHRGAFVERFDEDTVTEHHELNGLLNGMASARAAADRSPEVLDKLGTMIRQLRVLTEPRSFQGVVWEYRGVINADYAGPRLRALIRSSLAFAPRSFWFALSDSHTVLLPFYEAETAAILRGDAEAARAANIDRSATMGKIAIAELRRRRVLGDLGSH
jgi:DNA-binding GntR family transcriptional regulator